MRTVRLCSKSTPSRLSMNVVTKCRRVCSPSVMISIPKASCDGGPEEQASRSGGSVQVPRSEAATDVHLGAVAVADQLEAAFARGAVRGDPVADFRRSVADGGQALVEEIDEPSLVAVLEVADAFAVERLVDLPHGRLADRVAQAAGGEHRDPKVLRISPDRFREHRSPLQAATHARVGRLEIVEDDRNDRGQGIEPASPERDAEAVIERKAVRHRGLEVALERDLKNMAGEPRMTGDLLERAVLHPRLGRPVVSG